MSGPASGLVAYVGGPYVHTASFCCLLFLHVRQVRSKSAGVGRKQTVFARHENFTFLNEKMSQNNRTIINSFEKNIVGVVWKFGGIRVL